MPEKLYPGLSQRLQELLKIWSFMNCWPCVLSHAAPTNHELPNAYRRPGLQLSAHSQLFAELATFIKHNAMMGFIAIKPCLLGSQVSTLEKVEHGKDTTLCLCGQQ